jgi:beta-glucosidase
MTVSRREILSASAAAAHGAVAGGFGRRFLWGAATAGHQVEGNNVSSDVWLLEHVQPTMFSAPSGDACDSLNRWREDIAIIQALGLNAYRFSVEWARIEPEPGQWSLAMLDMYRAMVDRCRAVGITPVVTFSHFTTPRWFAARGGWEQPEAPARFADFCDQVARRLADGIGFAVTFNEPNLQPLGRWTLHPPGAKALAALSAMTAAAARACGSDRFSLINSGPWEVVAPNLFEGHRRARAAIKAARSGVPVGLSLALPDDQAEGPGSRIAEKRREVYEPFFELARDDDFIGVQTYNRSRIDAHGPIAPPAGARFTQTGDEYYPEAVGGAVRYAYAATKRPILVTENGVATTDDNLRAQFIPAAVKSMQAAAAEGVPVLGYIHWSLLDNFEWFSGFGPKFGLVAVDRQTFRRTPKASAHVLARIARAHAVA